MIYAVEVQVAYVASTLMKPIIDGYAEAIEVKEEAEERFVRDLDRTLDETVFAAGCNNWYINSAGRNSAAWPGLAVTFWKATVFPKWNDLAMNGGSRLWVFRKVRRNLTNTSVLMWLLAAGVTTYTAFNSSTMVRETAATLIKPLIA